MVAARPSLCDREPASALHHGAEKELSIPTAVSGIEHMGLDMLDSY